MIDLKNKTQIPDLVLVADILDGKTALYELLIRRNNPYLYKVGRSYGFSHHDVEDLMQETYISAYQNLKQFENRSSFKTWIIKIMLNQCYKKKHRLSYNNIILTDKEFTDTSMPVFSNHNHIDAGKTVVNRELNYVIENALAHIPEEYRMVFSLREMTGLNVSETAEALCISENNVKVRLNRAKNMLRKEVEKMYTTEDIYEFNLIYCDGMVNRVMKEIQELDIR